MANIEVEPVTTLAPEEVFERYNELSEENNPCGYTLLQMKKKDLAMKEMMKDYPKIPEMWISWIYDYCTNTPQEEVEDVINNGKWKVPTKRNWKGGTVKSMEVLTPEEYKELYGESGYVKHWRDVANNPEKEN